jgi:ATP-binding cassette subfamily C protein CydC
MIHILWRTLQLIRPFIGLMLLALLLGALTITSSIGLMATASWMLAQSALAITLAGVPTAVRLLGGMRGILRYAERLVSHDLTFKILAKARVNFYTKLEPLAPARLSKFRSGDLLARTVGDVEMMQNLYLRAVAPPLIALIVVLGTTFFIGMFDWIVASVALLWFVLGMVVLPAVAWWIGDRLGERQVMLRAELNATLAENLGGMAEILVYGGGKADQLKQTLDAIKRHERLMMFWEGFSNAGMLGLVQSSGLVVLVVALGRVESVYLALLSFTAIAVFEAITPITPAMQALSANLASAKRLFDVIDLPPLVADHGNPDLTPRDGSLTLQNVSFRYSPDSPFVWEDLNLQVNDGDHVALLGASGSGKSTLINLLARFYEYESGVITFGGHDLRAYSPLTLRDQIAVMEQRPTLFNTTFYENIHIGRPSASEAEVIQASQQAEIHDFIMTLPDGYQTNIGEDGGQLSGGQRQRIALARALLRSPKILILDEPIANLDPATGEAIMRTIFTHYHDRTVILLAHDAMDWWREYDVVGYWL